MVSRKLDAIDQKILVALQQDGRLKMSTLAEAIGLSVSPLIRRVGMLESAGVIERYVAVVNQRAVGLPVSVFVSIKMASQSEEALNSFADAIVQWPEVVEAYLMTGQRDYLLRVVTSDLDSYERFLKQKLTRLTGIASIESSFALQQVKHTNVLPMTQA